jgi:signal transduction histidine kinase
MKDLTDSVVKRSRSGARLPEHSSNESARAGNGPLGWDLAREIEARDAARRDLELITCFAHDLRSPLAAVLGFARLLRDEVGGESNPRAATLLARLERSAATIDEILRSGLRERPLRAKAADAREVLEQIRAERKASLELAGIDLSLPDDAPRVACCRSDLYRVLSNLIGNAIAHMGAPIRPAIRVSIECGEAFARLGVCDNGVGIEPELHERIFERSHSRCPTRDSASSHCGIGLAIVRELAHGWGGQAWAESEPGRGASFFVTVPLAREEA